MSQQTLGQDVSAEENLHKLFQVGLDNDEVLAQAGATLNLGLLYQKQGKHQQAVGYLEKHFELSRNVQNIPMEEEARVNLGLARAIIDLNNHLQSINSNDVYKLVNEKAKKIE